MDALADSRIETIPVKIRATLEKPPTNGKVEVVTFDAKARSRRALKILGMCWGMALLCIPIPIIHFTVLPTLLIAGVVLFVRMSGQSSQILGGEGTCPECRKTFRIAKADHRFPMDELCEHCRTSVSISDAATA
ncbi:MAG: hypothetical protein JST04_04980 [Bdellovibrionales bacterium]|nr:hypothetical protein [Bdellovibrionales bacterium]